jgi:hypothetical protein
MPDVPSAAPRALERVSGAGPAFIVARDRFQTPRLTRSRIGESPGPPDASAQTAQTARGIDRPMIDWLDIDKVPVPEAMGPIAGGHRTIGPGSGRCGVRDARAAGCPGGDDLPATVAPQGRRRRRRPEHAAGPQGMAYAELAGLPSISGLYTSIACLFGYAVFGPSRILVLGPESSLGPMIAAAVLPLAAGDQAVQAHDGQLDERPRAHHPGRSAAQAVRLQGQRQGPHLGGLRLRQRARAREGRGPQPSGSPGCSRPGFAAVAAQSARRADHGLDRDRRDVGVRLAAPGCPRPSPGPGGSWSRPGR